MSANVTARGKWTWKQVGSFNTPGCAIFWPDTRKGGIHYRRLDSKGGMLQADAEFIVSACNAHDALVTALNNLQANPNDPRAHRQALDVLKKVGAA